jgi:ABC-type sugar transport system substrate-binding protein
MVIRANDVDRRPPRIAVLLLTHGQDFQRAQENSARHAAAQGGLSVDVAFADNSPIVQVQQALDYVRLPSERRPTAIAIEWAGPPGALTGVARAALASGVGWVEVSAGASAIDHLRAEFPGRMVASVTTDDYAIGALQAVQCRTLLPHGGSVLYVEGPAVNTVVQMRRQALEEGLGGSSANIAMRLAADWTEAGAEAAASDWLEQVSARQVAPELVCAQNDAMAMGVLNPARARHVPWAGVPVVGCDGLPTVGLRYVREGALTTTIIKPVTAGPAVQWIARAIRGEALSYRVVLPPKSFPLLDDLARRGRALR